MNITSQDKINLQADSQEPEGHQDECTQDVQNYIKNIITEDDETEKKSSSSDSLHFQKKSFDQSNIKNIDTKSEQEQTQGLGGGGGKCLITNGEKLNQIMNNPELRQRIKDYKIKNNVRPVLKIEVQSQDNTVFELVQEDIHDAFKRYGNILNVTLLSQGKALITFDDIVNAWFAQKFLNGHVISELKVQLKVDFLDQDTLPNVKYTCRFEIQISNDKEFQVARKIIGSKGQNMKKIIEKSSLKLKLYDPKQEVVKLRLRGQGSGYREGLEKQESMEPLHLCVSSRYYDIYEIACQEVDNLLRQIYQDYAQFQKKKNIYFNPDIQIKKYQTTNGKGATETYLYQYSQAPMPQPYQQQQQYQQPQLQPSNQCNYNQINQQQQIHLQPRRPFEELNQYPQQIQQPQPQQQTQQYTVQTEQVVQSPPPIIDSKLPQDDQDLIKEEEIKQLIEARNKARRELNFQEADRIRNYLKERGVALMDEKGGRGKGTEVTTWKYSKKEKNQQQQELWQFY